MIAELAPLNLSGAEAPRGMRRAATAASRVLPARQALKSCRLCAHECGVNRLSGERGLCGAGADAHYFTAQIEVADELELVPTFAIALNGCDLRCKFCITGDMSWHARSGRGAEASILAAAARQALDEGARSIMVLGGEPTIHLPTLLELVAALPDSARLVLKTNGHCSQEARGLLDGIFDDWVVDFKFGNDGCALGLARVPNYLPVLKENLLWAAAHSRLIIRHLLLPGHVQCCWAPIARWIATYLPEAKVSLRDGYWPAWHARRMPPLNQPLPTPDGVHANVIAAEYELNLIP